MANPPDKNQPGAGNNGKTDTSANSATPKQVKTAQPLAQPAVNSGTGGKPATGQPAQTPPPLPKSAQQTKPAAGIAQSRTPQAKTTQTQTTPAKTPQASASQASATQSTTRSGAAQNSTVTGGATPNQSKVETRQVSTAPTTQTERSKFDRPAPARTDNSRPPSAPPGKPGRSRPPEHRGREYRERPPGRPAGAYGAPRRPVRPGRRMAPPPGAVRGRFVAPAARPARRAAAPVAGTGSWVPLLLGLLLLGGVLWYAMKHYAPNIESDLATRSNNALAEAGLGNQASVEIDGRDAILTGTVPGQSDSDRAEEVVASTIGVRSVENNLAVGDKTEAAGPRTDPTLTLFSTDNGVRLGGIVSDQEYADKIESAAKEIYGADNVSGSITVDANSTNPGWWPAVQQLAPELSNIKDGSLSVAAGSLILTGSAPDKQTKNDLGEKAEQQLQGQLTVANRISVMAATPAPAPEPVPTTKPANATFYNSTNRIQLYGNMPAESAAEIESAFAGSAKPVDSLITISDEFQAPPWSRNFGRSLAAMQDIDKGKVAVQSNGQVLISGIASSEEAKQNASDQIADAFVGKIVSNRIVVRTPAPEPELVAPTMAPFASVTDNGSEVKLVGLLPAGSADAIVATLESSGKTVVSNVSIDERVMEPAWVDAIVESLDTMGAIENPRVNISSSGELTLSGLADNDTARQLAADNTWAAFGNSVSLRNDITVKGPDISELIAQIDLAAVRFRTNSSELDADSINILEQVADALGQVPSATIEIAGHTDSTGNDQRNLTLSGERAEQVRNFLIDRGISSDRMTSRGYGSSQPIASNETVTGRALNRRIELVLTNGAEMLAKPLSTEMS